MRNVDEVKEREMRMMQAGSEEGDDCLKGVGQVSFAGELEDASSRLDVDELGDASGSAREASREVASSEAGQGHEVTCGSNIKAKLQAQLESLNASRNRRTSDVDTKSDVKVHPPPIHGKLCVARPNIRELLLGRAQILELTSTHEILFVAIGLAAGTLLVRTLVSSLQHALDLLTRICVAHLCSRTSTDHHDSLWMLPPWLV